MRKVSKLAKASIKTLFSELYGNRSVLCEPIVTGPYVPLSAESESHDNEDQTVLSIASDEF